MQVDKLLKKDFVRIKPVTIEGFEEGFFIKKLSEAALQRFTFSLMPDEEVKSTKGKNRRSRVTMVKASSLKERMMHYKGKLIVEALCDKAGAQVLDATQADEVCQKLPADVVTELYNEICIFNDAENLILQKDDVNDYDDEDEDDDEGND